MWNRMWHFCYAQLLSRKIRVQPTRGSSGSVTVQILPTLRHNGVWSCLRPEAAKSPQDREKPPSYTIKIYIYIYIYIEVHMLHTTSLQLKIYIYIYIYINIPLPDILSACLSVWLTQSLTLCLIQKRKHTQNANLHGACLLHASRFRSDCHRQQQNPNEKVV
jgi:hypothetical protein